MVIVAVDVDTYAERTVYDQSVDGGSLPIASTVYDAFVI